MTAELTQILDDYIEDDYLPPELILDAHHPANDKYYRDLKHIQRQIIACCAPMRLNKRESIKLMFTGMTAIEAAKKLNINPNTISKYRNSENGKRLHSLLTILAQQTDGPNKQHRQGILYRIAIDNEDRRPGISISALQEINKMTGAHEQGDVKNNQINIQINGVDLPKGPLDVLPETYETRLIENDDSD